MKSAARPGIGCRQSRVVAQKDDRRTASRAAAPGPSGNGLLAFEDRRPEAATRQLYPTLTGDSPRMRQLKTLQDLANRHTPPIIRTGGAPVRGARQITQGIPASSPHRSQASGHAVAQRMPIKCHNGTYYPTTHNLGQDVESDELTRNQRKKVSSDLSNNPVLLRNIRQGWGAADQNIDPVVTSLPIDDRGTRVKATRLLRASQDTTGTLKNLLGAQQVWQDYLQDEKIQKQKVLSVHRSFGMEYEFATWELAQGQTNEVQSHTEAGKSSNFSKLFDVPFVLETDAQQELELVAPPLLAGEAGGGLGKVFMKAAHKLFIDYLVRFRSDNEGVQVAYLPFEGDGLGSGWSWETEAGRIQIAGERKKWANKEDQIAYQLNVALTPAEIAAEIARVGDQALDNEHGMLYKKIRQRFLTEKTYRDLSNTRRKGVFPALLILSKGLSNSIAIPTLTLVARTRTPWARGDMHSYVKDLHALWIKDSVPNITVASVSDDVNAKADLLAILNAVRNGQDLIPRDVLTSIPPYKPQGINLTPQIEELLGEHDPDEQQSTRLKHAAEAEAKACLDDIENRLGQHKSEPEKNPGLEFLKEQFGSGAGVRKDTYANIGKSDQGTLHLAEFRSVASTDQFLG